MILLKGINFSLNTEVFALFAQNQDNGIGMTQRNYCKDMYSDRKRKVKFLPILFSSGIIAAYA